MKASSGKDLARALAKLSPGGMSEFVQSVPVNVAGFSCGLQPNLLRCACGPLNMIHKDDVSNRRGPAAIEACG